LLRTDAMLTKKKNDAMTDTVDALGTLLLKNLKKCAQDVPQGPICSRRVLDRSLPK
jgi:hypothetical protein